MPQDLILPLSLVMAFTAYSLIAKWYVMPVLRSLPLARALTPLLLFHSFRFVGLAFLIPGVTSQPLDSRFANPAHTATCLLPFSRSWQSLRCVADGAPRLPWCGYSTWRVPLTS